MKAIFPGNLELLREALISCAAASTPNAVTLAIVRMHCRIMGHNVEDDRLRAELDFLVGSEILQCLDNPLSGVNKSWKITAKGRLFAEEKGLS